MDALMSSMAYSRRLPGISLIRGLLELCNVRTIGLPEGPDGVIGTYRRGEHTYCSMSNRSALHMFVSAPPGNYLTCYFHCPTMGSWCAGSPLQPDTVLVVPPEATCELMLNTDSIVTFVVAPFKGALMSGSCERVVARGVEKPSFFLLAPEAHVGTPFSGMHSELFERLLNDAGSRSLRFDDEMNEVLDHEEKLRSWLVASSPTSPYVFTDHFLPGHLSGYSALRSAVEFMGENLHRDLYMSEVAEAIRMSERSLALIFERLLDVSPAKYLSLYRIHQAAILLSRRGVKRLSVKSVALDCGYWHLSRFAAHYRRVHGEYPSATLARSGRMV